MANGQNDDRRVWIDNNGVIHVEDERGSGSSSSNTSRGTGSNSNRGTGSNSNGSTGSSSNGNTGSNSNSSSGGGGTWIILIVVAILGYLVFGGSGGTSDTTESSSNQESGTVSATQSESSSATVFIDSNGWLTAEGTLQRLEQTTSQTGMGWSRVAYLLVFDATVPITYTDGFGNSVMEYMDSIAIDVIEQSGDDANRNLNLVTIDKWEPYVGQRITVTGRLFDTGNAHTVGPVMLVESRIV